MAYRLFRLVAVFRLVAAWWATTVLVVIGGWKTAEFAVTLARNTQEWPLRAMAGLLFFGPFIASELMPLERRSLLLKITKSLLFSFLLAALVVQTLNETQLRICEGIERQRFEALKTAVSHFEEVLLRNINDVYQALLRENLCLTARNKRKSIVACEILWKQYQEILDTPRLYIVDPPSTAELRDSLRQRLDKLAELSRKVPPERRVFEYVTPFDLTGHEHGMVEMLSWVAHHYPEQSAQDFLAGFLRSLMLLVLTVVVGIWHHATTDLRRNMMDGSADCDRTTKPKAAM